MIVGNSSAARRRPCSTASRFVRSMSSARWITIPIQRATASRKRRSCSEKNSGALETASSTHSPTQRLHLEGHSDLRLHVQPYLHSHKFFRVLIGMLAEIGSPG